MIGGLHPRPPTGLVGHMRRTGCLRIRPLYTSTADRPDLVGARSSSLQSPSAQYQSSIGPTGGPISLTPSRVASYCSRHERDHRSHRGQARPDQVKTLQADIDALQRAASVLGGETTAKTTPARQPTTSPAQPSAKRKRKPWSEAARKAMSKRVKAYWAKRKRARR